MATKKLTKSDEDYILAKAAELSVEELAKNTDKPISLIEKFLAENTPVRTGKRNLFAKNQYGSIVMTPGESLQQEDIPNILSGQVRTGDIFKTKGEN